MLIKYVSVSYSMYILVYVGFILIACKIFCYLTMGWNKSNVCLVGKTVIITGGRSGLGLQTAMILGSRGAKVIIANRKDSTKARQTIIEQTKNPNIISKFLDLADFNSIRAFAKEINETEERLDILINNSGVAGRIEGVTIDGLPLQMQINHLGPFLLTHLLIDKLKKSAPSRIIFVASTSAYTNFLTVEHLDRPRSDKIFQYNDYINYARTKLCNVISAEGFAEKLKGTGVTCNSCHPGIVTTPLVAKVFLTDNNIIKKKILYGIVGIFGKQTNYMVYSRMHKKVDNKFLAACPSSIFCNYDNPCLRGFEKPHLHNTILKKKNYRELFSNFLLHSTNPYQGAQTHAYLAMAKEVEDVTGKFFIDCIPFLKPLTLRDKKFCEEIWKRSEELVKLDGKEKL